jgi:PIN domain nuclease of toxin-antitoxin system
LKEELLREVRRKGASWFPWWITDDAGLSGRARGMISDGRNELFFSVASGWEISIKAGLGRLEIPGEKLPATPSR